MSAPQPIRPAQPPVPPLPLDVEAVRRGAWVRVPSALLRTARPRQWVKNLLVFAAPLTGSELTARQFEARGGSALGGAALAFVVFTLASCAVYFVNDTVDAERDRQHPRKCRRPIASGELSEGTAVMVAGLCLVAALTLSLTAPGYGLTVAVTAYLVTSFLYSLGLKHLAVLELTLVASGFVLRALGGAASSQVPPSGWFVLVCSLGALLVATAKRHTELAGLGGPAAAHRPSLQHYTAPGLRVAQRVIALAMVAAYLAWALMEPDPRERVWHVATVLPLVAALVRFDRLTSRGTTSHIEDLLIRDTVMIMLELCWLVLFAVGFAAPAM
ncbi:decaprenyl-phosphate phosphoribosyltransferase [Streptacidiphilus jiangxiensis]|uniref:Decaprenyl-phosphate phosphoribosyltransferase n=1 Tax=Streptacidiphilus jiangxiensis TaxID=235985 RepID=A0A1H7RB20_STRJI|nr:decaprenyl-phosphate phosphoribosyltransferase [Streptacidiphilus jiangxiensis]SEL57329.1 decaprenyl-phosphate phosphoribosyltransferase [Streptacidiphilus jiangxiensis]